MLQDFCQSVQSRARKAGFDWSTLIVTLLPVVVEMISNCFNKSSDLQAFCEGKRDPLQRAGLRNKCRRVVQEQGVKGVFRVAAAANVLERAILDEIDQRVSVAGNMAGDMYQAVLDEAMSV